VDNTTGYLVSALRKIQEGTLKGSLKPLVQTGSLPDFTKVYAGQIEIYPGLYSSGVFSESYIEKHHKKISLWKALLLWGLIIIAIVVVYMLIK
jgi:hypothetical protein